MKFFLLFLFLTTSALAACEVDGISDSPQALSCVFGRRPLTLRCEGSRYFINDELVDVAYHEEVETGNSPLVFRTRVHKLRATLEGRGFSAEWETERGKFTGTCRTP